MQQKCRAHMFIRMCVHMYTYISCRNHERQCRRYICLCVYMWPQTRTCRESVVTRTQFVPLIYMEHTKNSGSYV